MQNISKIKTLLEIRSKSLQKLGDENAIDVLAEFPADATRLLLGKIESEISTLANKRYIMHKIKDELKANWTSKNIYFSDNYFSLPLEFDSGIKMSLRISVIENKIYYDLNTLYLALSQNTINLKNKSLNFIFDEIVDTTEEVYDAMKKELVGKNIPFDKYEKINRELKNIKVKHENNKEPQIIKRISMIAKKFNLRVEKDDETSNKTTVSITVSYDLNINSEKLDSMYIDLYDRTKNSFNCRFQLEKLIKFVNLLEKRLRDNGYYFVKLIFTYNQTNLFARIKFGNPEDFDGASDNKLIDLHNMYLDSFRRAIKNFKYVDGKKDISEEEFLRALILKIFKS